jgi:hypothetical protein
MRWIRLSALLATSVVVVAGCANVKVKKVDLERRLAGKDNHVRGFRYYLSRPYLVVTRQVHVATQLIPVVTGQLRNAPPNAVPKLVFVSLVPDATGKYVVYTPAGKRHMSLDYGQIDTLIESKPLPPIATTGIGRSGPVVAVAVPADARRILARTVAARAFRVIETEHARAGQSVQAQPEPFERLAAKLEETALRHDAAPGESVRSYGTRLIPILLRAASNELKVRTQQAADSGREQVRGAIEALADSLTVALFVPGTQPVTWQLVTARAVAVLAADAASEAVPGLEAERKAAITVWLGEAASLKSNSGDASHAPEPLDRVVAATLSRLTSEMSRAGGLLSAQEGPAVARLTDAQVRRVLFSDGQQEPGRDRSVPAPRPSENSVFAPGVRSPQPPTTGPGQSPAPGVEAPKQASPPINGSRGGQDDPNKPQPTEPGAAAANAGSAAPAPAFQVMFLPDFEEQYAIRNKNVLAKTKYQYVFRNGTSLAAVSGDYNATDVPVKIIETVGKLLSTAAELAGPKLAGAPTHATSGARAPGQGARSAPYFIKLETIIEPGVYRVQKSWEQVAAVPPEDLAAEDVGGLFTEIGLKPVVVSSVLTAEQGKNELAKLQAEPEGGPVTPKK